MKKIKILLIIALSMSILIGCGKSSESNGKDSNSQKKSKVVDTVTEDTTKVTSGEIKDDAVIAGKAIIGSLCLQKPLISGDSRVYGMVQGNVHVNGNIFSWEKIEANTQDTHIFEHGQWSISPAIEKLQPPLYYPRKKTKKKNPPER